MATWSQFVQAEISNQSLSDDACEAAVNSSSSDDDECVVAELCADDGNYCVVEDDDDESDNALLIGREPAYDIDTSLSLREQLGRWCVSYNVSASAFSVLLKILLAYGVAAELPRDSRTVLQTARHVVTKSVSGGEYFHFGLVGCLKSLIGSLSKSAFDKLKSTLDIVISMDGLPCFKSVNTHFWPILGSLHALGKQSKPFSIGVFYGVEKDQNVHDFLEDFVREYNQARTEGFYVRDRHFKVLVYAVVCDAPARAFVKNVYNHSSLYPCERCKIGSDKKKYRFHGDNAHPRTDTNVLEMDPNHNKGPSPLSRCDIKLVTQVVLDYMHLVLLGIVKKFTLMWFETKKKEDVHRIRVDPKKMDKISAHLLSFIETCPHEFGRKPRSIGNYRMYKATEFRTFLLYTGMVALKCHVRLPVYQNFLLLQCAMRIFLSPRYCGDRNYMKHGKLLLKSFVSHYRIVYGIENVVYNVHSLQHLYQDVKRYGSLDKVSAFPFENHLKSYKVMIRNGTNTLQQVVRRIAEETRFAVPDGSSLEDNNHKRYLHEHNFPLPSSLQDGCSDVIGQYKAVHVGNCRFSVFPQDSCIRLPDESVGKVVNVVQMRDGSCQLMYKKYQERKPFFTYPMNSEAIGISEVQNLSACTYTEKVERCRKAWLLRADVGCWPVAVDLLECELKFFRR